MGNISCILLKITFLAPERERGGIWREWLDEPIRRFHFLVGRYYIDPLEFYIILDFFFGG